MAQAETETSEWLEADGLGGFASGTISTIRTRRYHALLLAATEPPAGRMVLVNGFDAEVETSAGTLALTTQRYAPDVNHPDGVTRMEHFSPDPWPQWSFALPNGKIVFELFVPREIPAVVLRWSRSGQGAAPLKLRMRPFFSGRDFHATHHENPAFRFDPENLPFGQRWQFYDGVPKVTALHNGDYRHEPCWYRNFFYEEEANRGLDATEDLAAPGILEFDLTAGQAVVIFAAETPGNPLPEFTGVPELAEALANTERTRRAVFSSPRLRAADAYLVRRGTGRTIIAGYPWFGDWGRDTFIALRGLCLATGRLPEARDILTAWAGAVSEGMMPNRFPDRGDQPEYNSADASLWYVIAVHEFLESAKADPSLPVEIDVLLASVEAILTGYWHGTRYGIRGSPDGLLACGVPGVQLTWMDAKIGDRVVTPRIGKPVEIEALWLNALACASHYNPAWDPIFQRGLTAFQSRFWNEERSCLFDVVDADHQPGKTDEKLRPNQIFAVGGLPLMLIQGDHAARLLQTVQDHLWTPMGLRSLAPGEEGYTSHYEGAPEQRDSAYHQGAVWPWLAGPFIEAWIRVKGQSPQAKAEATRLFLTPQLARLDLPGLHHVPEIAETEPPFTARGCPFQAWSVGEIIRIERLIGGSG
ncbi:MAG: amylo-alpha-1,6-glucosidase [Methylacidiphilales bacterium]|nr:amylo-alpha-1,6-glucosidase [Candidatus Methylacidiphilales bacterium]